MKFGVGQSVARVEDHRLLRGRGRFTDDINLPGQLHGCVVRSPHPHARIAGIDTAPALAAPGVVAVFTGADVEADGLGTLPSLARGGAALARPDGSPLFEPPRPALQPRKVSFVGDCVAFVVADTAARARDAAERVDVEYEPLPLVTSAEAALSEGAPAVWEDCPDNVCYRIRLGDAEAVEAAVAGAAHVTRVRLPISRVCMNPMEPRAALGDHDPSDGRYTLHTGSQNVHAMREWIARDVLGVPESQLRVVSPDMGGSFGLRSTVFPEMALVLWASRRLGRPVKWTGDRTEAHLADDHARDQVMDIELALDGEGRFLALRVRVVAAMGAYLSFFGPFPPFVNLGGLAGVYRTPAICADVHAVFTNTTPTAPYRGAGRPEAVLAIEHAIDRAAREIGIDRVELRRRNLIPPDAMPFRTGLAYRYDCGEFERNMDEALAAIDVEAFAARRAASRAGGRPAGPRRRQHHRAVGRGVRRVGHRRARSHRVGHRVSAPIPTARGTRRCSASSSRSGSGSTSSGSASCRATPTRCPAGEGPAGRGSRCSAARRWCAPWTGSSSAAGASRPTRWSAQPATWNSSRAGSGSPARIARSAWRRSRASHSVRPCARPARKPG